MDCRLSVINSKQFYIILETLDTEEASYIWTIDKEISTLKNKLIEIDKSLNLIRIKGRQAFLESNPKNFIRILHDYSDDRKGFIKWKDALEEILV